MSSGIEVNAEALRRGGAQVRQAADRLREEWARFSAQVQARGDIFGDDDVGGLIGVSYQVAHEIADDSFTSVADAFEGFADGLHRSADKHEQTDLAAAEVFHRMLG